MNGIAIIIIMAGFHYWSRGIERPRTGGEKQGACGNEDNDEDFSG